MTDCRTCDLKIGVKVKADFSTLPMPESVGTGTIRVIEDIPEGYLYGIELDEEIGCGHALGGILPEGSQKGYWLTQDYLEVML